MRDVLSDIVRQAALFDTVKVTGSATETIVEAAQDKGDYFLRAKLNEPIPEFDGEFGITNLTLLQGLLNFASYKTEAASLAVRRRELQGKEIVDQLEFRDARGHGADFKFMSAALVPEQAVIHKIQWELSFEPDKSRVAEFFQLSKLYASVDGVMRMSTTGGDLNVGIGEENSSTHRVSMVFEPNVDGTMRAPMQFNTSHFGDLIKVAGAYPFKLSLTRGLMGVKVETPYGSYEYLLRAKKN